MSAHLARYLKDFGPSRPAGPVADLGFSDVFDDGAFPPVEEPTPVDIEAEMRQAHESGYEQATAELAGKHAAELAALAEQHQQEIAALRDRHAAESAGALAAGMTRIAERVAHEVSEQVALILAPIVTDVLTRKAVEDLAEMVRGAVLEGAVGKITVRGPSHLFEKLEVAFGENAALLHHVEADDLDLAVEIGGSVIVTRLSAWAASLKKVLE